MICNRKIIIFLITVKILTLAALAQNANKIIRDGDIKRLKQIVDKNENLIFSKDRSEKTLLHYSAMYGQKEIAEYLINKGAEIDCRDLGKMTPLHWAALRGHQKTIKVLVSYKADIDALDMDGQTPLSLAVYMNNQETVKTLIDCGSDLNTKMKSGETILHHAAEVGNIEVIEILVKNETNINAEKEYNVTPLHIVAVFGHIETVKLLIERGADLNVKSKFAGMPIHQAEAAGQKEIVELLLKNGAERFEREFPEFKGEFLGMDIPGKKLQFFAPGVINSVHRWVSTPVFLPNGREMYWSAGAPHGVNHHIWFMEQVDGIWKPPRIAPFSGDFSDQHPVLSGNGNMLFFHSNRPLAENSEARNNSDIWMVERREKNWGEPRNLGPVINNDKNQNNVSVSKNLNLYFQGNNYEGGYGGSDIYCSEHKNGEYVSPVNLGGIVNSLYIDGGPYIAPDESYIIYSSSRPGGFAKISDLYISFRKNNRWLNPVNLGKEINAGRTVSPKITSDGKYLFITRNRNNTYWISTEIIEKLKPEELKKE